VEKVQELEKEYKNLDLILQGTQRENERCMAELERFVCCCLWSWLLIDLVHFARSARTREKMLERELAKLAGENWQVRPLICCYSCAY